MIKENPKANKKPKKQAKDKKPNKLPNPAEFSKRKMKMCKVPEEP